jgi:hypothetical protein
MATSGIEKNVKLWLPSDETPPVTNPKREAEWQDVIKANKTRVRKISYLYLIISQCDFEARY